MPDIAELLRELDRTKKEYDRAEAKRKDKEAKLDALLKGGASDEMGGKLDRARDAYFEAKRDAEAKKKEYEKVLKEWIKAMILALQFAVDRM